MKRVLYFFVLSMLCLLGVEAKKGVKDLSVAPEDMNLIEHRQQDHALGDKRKCAKKKMKKGGKGAASRLNSDVNWFLVNDHYRWNKYHALIGGKEIQIDDNQRESLKDVDSLYEYSSIIVIKGIEIDMFDDAAYGYVGYHDVYPGYVDISDYEKEDSVLRQIPQAELKEMTTGNGHEGYKKVRLIPKRYIEKMMIRRSPLDWETYKNTGKAHRIGESRVIAEMDMRSIEGKSFDLFKKNGMIWSYEDLSALQNDEYVSSFISRYGLTCRTSRNALLMTYRKRYVFILTQIESSEIVDLFFYDTRTEQFLDFREHIWNIFGADRDVDYPRGKNAEIYRYLAFLDKYLKKHPKFEMSELSDYLITNVEMKAMYGL